MAIRVVPYTGEWVEGVRAFNRRMEAGGVHWRWYEDPVDEWMPERSARVWREHYLAVEEDDEVRGAYALKPHEWRIHGRPQLVTDWQGPITEGILSRRYSMVGLRILRGMLKQYPLLYSWGHGGAEQPMLDMLRKLGWLLHGTPFCLRIVKPFRFLRRNHYLRTSGTRRLALDVLAWSGLGPLGIRALHAALRLRPGRSAPARAEPFERFEAWADALWERCGPAYAAIGTRDAETMNALVPVGGWPPGIRLRVRRGNETIGWAVVLDTPMTGDRRFGRCRVGSIVDGLALPEDAEAVAGAAFRFLRGRGVDLVISNQSHPAWLAGLARHGFLLLPGRRVFAASPPLAEALSPFEETKRGLHLTNMDGHGPMRL